MTSQATLLMNAEPDWAPKNTRTRKRDRAEKMTNPGKRAEIHSTKDRSKKNTLFQNRRHLIVLTVKMKRRTLLNS